MKLSSQMDDTNAWLQQHAPKEVFGEYGTTEWCYTCGGDHLMPHWSNSQRALEADRREHKRRHEEILRVHAQAIRKYRHANISWPPPEIKRDFRFVHRYSIRGIYQAFSELNPRLRGFKAQGLTETDWQSFQQGEGEMVIRLAPQGQGSNQYGAWIAPDRRRFTFDCSWGQGKANFWQE